MRPIFTVHAGEYLVGSEIEKKFKDLRVWIPSKDTGIDLLVTDKECEKTVTIQKKFSKDFLYKNVKEKIAKGIKSGGWWTFSRNKIVESPADLWILVLYQFKKKEDDFIIIPPLELMSLYNKLERKQENIQTYFWVTKNKKCWETRKLGKDDLIRIANDEYKDIVRDMSYYLNNWNIFTQLL